MQSNFIQWFAEWLACWQAQSLWSHLLAILAGLFGACVNIALTGPELALPRYDRKGQTIKLNFLGTLIIGIAAAVVADVAFPVGVVAALLAPPVASILMKKLPAALVRALLAWLPPEKDSEVENDG